MIYELLAAHDQTLRAYRNRSKTKSGQHGKRARNRNTFDPLVGLTLPLVSRQVRAEALPLFSLPNKLDLIGLSPAPLATFIPTRLLDNITTLSLNMSQCKDLSYAEDGLSSLDFQHLSNVSKVEVSNAKVHVPGRELSIRGAPVTESIMDALCGLWHTYTLWQPKQELQVHVHLLLAYCPRCLQKPLLVVSL